MLGVEVVSRALRAWNWMYSGECDKAMVSVYWEYVREDMSLSVLVKCARVRCWLMWTWWSKG